MAFEKVVEDYINYKQSKTKLPKWSRVDGKFTSCDGSASKRTLHIAMIEYVLSVSPERGLRGCCNEFGLGKTSLARYLNEYAFNIDAKLAKLVFARMYYNKKQQYYVDKKIGLTARTRKALENRLAELKTLSDRDYMRRRRCSSCGSTV